MSVDLPIEVVRAMRAEDTGSQPVWLLKVYDSNGSLHVANDYRDIVGPDGATYSPYPFRVTLPTQTGKESPVLKVSVDDIRLVIVDDLVRSAGTREALKADMHIVQRGVLQSGSRDRHEAVVSYKGFDVVQAQSNRKSLQFSMTIRNYLDAPLTKYWFGPGDFPGLF